MLFKLFKRFFNSDIDALLNARENSVRREITKLREDTNLISMQQLVGKPVIVISNEWDNPIVGIASRIEFITLGKCPILIVKNYIDGIEYMTFGKVFAFSSQKLRAVFKLSPFELCSLIYYQYAHVEFNKDIRHELIDYETVLSKLTANGFFSQFDHSEVE